MTGDSSAFGEKRERSFNELIGEKADQDARIQLSEVTYTPPGQPQSPQQPVLTGRATFGHVADPALKASAPENQDTGYRPWLEPGYRAQPVPPTGFQGRTQGGSPGVFVGSPRGDRLPPGGVVVPPVVAPLDGGAVAQPKPGTYNPAQAPSLLGDGRQAPANPNAPGGPGDWLKNQVDGKMPIPKQGELALPRDPRLVPNPGLPGIGVPNDEPVPAGPGGDGRGPAAGAPAAGGDDRAPAAGAAGARRPKRDLEGPLGEIPPATDKQRTDVTNSLKLQVNIDTYMLEGALGGVIGSGPVPFLMDRLTMKPFTMQRLGVYGGAGALIGAGVGAIWDKDNVPRDTLIGAGLGAGVSLLSTNPVAKYWRDNHSPIEIEAQAKLAQGADFRKQFDTSNVELGKASKLAKELEGSLAAEAGTIQKWVTETEASLIKEEVGTLNHVLLSRRYNTLLDLRSNPCAVDAQFLQHSALGPGETTLGGGKLFTKAESELLIQRHAQYAEKGVQEKLAVAAKEKVDAAVMQGSKIDLEAKLIRTGKTSEFDFLGLAKNKQNGDGLRAPKPWENAAAGEEADILRRAGGRWRGAELRWKVGEGILVASSALALDYGIDKLMGTDQNTIPNQKYWLEGPAMAVAFCAPKMNTMMRVGVVATAIGLEKVGIPYIMPSLEKSYPLMGEYSKVMQPNWIDAVGMSTAWMMPFKSQGARLKALGGAYAAGRVADIAVNYFDAPIPGIRRQDQFKDMYESLNSTVAKASGKFDHDTFKDLVKKGTDMGMENEGALVLTHNDFYTKHKNDADPMDKYHTGAALLTSLGNFWLARGVKYMEGHNDVGRLFAGKNIDMGGHAANFFFVADRDLKMAQDHAKTNGFEVPEIADSRKMINERLKLIFGEHDIPELIKETKKDYGSYIDINGKKPNASDGLISILKDMVAQTRTLPRISPGEKKVASKMCRDVALLSLAIASAKADKGDGAGAAMIYTDAARFLKAAKIMEPDHPDVKAMIDASQKIGPEVEAARNSQYKSKTNAPFQHK